MNAIRNWIYGKISRFFSTAGWRLAAALFVSLSFSPSSSAQTLTDEWAAAGLQDREAETLLLSLDDQNWMQLANRVLQQAGASPAEQDSLAAYIQQFGALIDRDELYRLPALSESSIKALKAEPLLWQEFTFSRPRNFGLIRGRWLPNDNSGLARVHYKEEALALKVSLREGDQLAGAMQVKASEHWRVQAGQLVWQRGSGIYTSWLAQSRLQLNPQAVFSSALPSVLLYDGAAPQFAVTGISAQRLTNGRELQVWAGGPGQNRGTSFQPMAGLKLGRQLNTSLLLEGALQAGGSSAATEWQQAQGQFINGNIYGQYQQGQSLLRGELILGSQQLRAGSLAWHQQLLPAWQIFAVAGAAQVAQQPGTWQLAPLEDLNMMGLGWAINPRWNAQAWGQWQGRQQQWASRVDYKPSRYLSAWLRYRWQAGAAGHELRGLLNWQQRRNLGYRVMAVINNGWLLSLQPVWKHGLRAELAGGLSIYQFNKQGQAAIAERALATSARIHYYQGGGSSAYLLATYRIFTDFRIQARVEYEVNDLPMSGTWGNRQTRLEIQGFLNL